MPRIARVVAEGYPHHITQRGNYRQLIFSEDRDRRRYLSLIQTESHRYGLKILAYCLMDNHVHFIGVPERTESLGNVFKYANMRYSQYYNRKIGSPGHLFQGRYYSCVMDESHTVTCARYIERNPVRAGTVQRPHSYKWSSAAVHCGMADDDPLNVAEFFNYVDMDPRGWKEFIDEEDNREDVRQIREKARTGRVLANEELIRVLERKLARSLRVKRKGRPTKREK